MLARGELWGAGPPAPALHMSLKASTDSPKLRGEYEPAPTHGTARLATGPDATQGQGRSPRAASSESHQWCGAPHGTTTLSGLCPPGAAAGGPAGTHHHYDPGDLSEDSTRS